VYDPALNGDRVIRDEITGQHSVEQLGQLAAV
jgi:hypothetical protein